MTDTKMHKKIYRAIILFLAISVSFFIPKSKLIQASGWSGTNLCGGTESCPELSSTTFSLIGNQIYISDSGVNGGAADTGDNRCPVGGNDHFYYTKPDRLSYWIDKTNGYDDGTGALLSGNIAWLETQPWAVRYDDGHLSYDTNTFWGQTPCNPHSYQELLFQFPPGGGQMNIDASSLANGTYYMHIAVTTAGGFMEYWQPFTISASTSSFTLNPSNVNTPYCSPLDESCNADSGTYSPGSGVQISLSGRDYYLFTDDGSPHQQSITPGIYTVTVSGLNDDGTKNITVPSGSYLSDPGTYDSSGHSLHPEQAIYSFTGTSYASYPINTATISCPSGGTCKLNINFETRPYLNVQ